MPRKNPKILELQDEVQHLQGQLKACNEGKEFRIRIQQAALEEIENIQQGTVDIVAQSAIARCLAIFKQVI